MIAFEYGLDAPPVVRNLLLAAGALLWLGTLGVAGMEFYIIVGSAFRSGYFLMLIPLAMMWITGLAKVFPRACLLAGGTLGLVAVLSILGPGFVVGPALGAGCFLCVSALAMMWLSKFGKLMRRERLLDRLTWRGDERVLDIGCGRGLMVVGAARRLATGRATGIDIWQAEDLSGNRPTAVTENAARERVADRVDAETADMRELPFAAASFDVIVSCTAIHNVYERHERLKVILEIDRVLAPGGRLLIDDIRHLKQYAASFRALGWTDVKSVGSTAYAWFWTIVSLGSIHPGTLLATKP